jgi:anti-anti-sigma regulatory factor
MQGDPLWIDVTALMRAGSSGLGQFVAALAALPEDAAKIGEYVGRLSRLLGA